MHLVNLFVYKGISKCFILLENLENSDQITFAFLVNN